MTIPSGRRFKFLGLAIVATTYGISFILPAVRVFSEPMLGYEAFCIITVFFDASAAEIFAISTADARLLLAWSPNLSIWVGAALFALGRWRAAALVAGLALIVGNYWWTDVNNLKVNWDNLFVGYYVWVASMAVLALLSAFQSLREGVEYTDHDKGGGILTSSAT